MTQDAKSLIVSGFFTAILLGVWFFSLWYFDARKEKSVLEEQQFGIANARFNVLDEVVKIEKKNELEYFVAYDKACRRLEGRAVLNIFGEPDCIFKSVIVPVTRAEP